MDDPDFKFSGRADAGRQLAEKLAAMDLKEPLIFALPRGGVPVAVEISRKLDAPLDLIVVRRIAAPGHPENALGAVVEGAVPQVVISEDVRRMSSADMDNLQCGYADQLVELKRRLKLFVGDRKRLDPAGRTAVVVDDGLATGAAMKAALTALSRKKAARIVLAVPVAPDRTLADLAELADDIVCLQSATGLRGVAGVYRDFRPLSDEDTISLLRQHDADQARAHLPDKDGNP